MTRTLSAPLAATQLVIAADTGTDHRRSQDSTHNGSLLSNLQEDSLSGELEVTLLHTTSVDMGQSVDGRRRLFLDAEATGISICASEPRYQHK